MDEKRAVLRRRTYYAAQLSCRNGIAWSDAVVRNLSDAGALIEAPNSPIPDMLDMVIPMAGVRTAARVAWRGEGRAGLQFERTRAAPQRPNADISDGDPNY